jgi:hypothetical protein
VHHTSAALPAVRLFAFRIIPRKINLAISDRSGHREYTECQAFCPVVRIRSLPLPHPQASVAPPPFGSKGGDTLVRGVGVGGHNSDEGTATLILYMYINAGEARWVANISANFFAKQTSEKPSRDGRVDEGQRTG